MKGTPKKLIFPEVPWYQSSGIEVEYIKEKPPVINDEDIKAWIVSNKEASAEMVDALLPPLAWSLEAQRDADAAYYEALIQQAEDALEAARAAILDAIYCEDGLDGHTGSVVMEWITDILGDEKEYRPTIEGLSSQTQISEDKAFLHRDQLIQQAKAEVAREIQKGIIETYPGVGWLYNQPKWQAFWDKYLKETKEQERREE